MPWMIVPEGGKFNVYKQDAPGGKPIGKMLGSHPKRKQAVMQLRALYASERNSKKALPNTVGNILQASIHDSFTNVADMLAMMGYVNVDQRIRMSNMIGDFLGTVSGTLKEINDIVVQPDDVDCLIGDDSADDSSNDTPDMPDTMNDAGMGMNVSDMTDMLMKAIEPNVGGGVDRSKLKDTQFVFPDERAFPIVIAKDVGDAVDSWGRYRGKHSFEEFKSKLTSLAKRLGFADSLPTKWEEKSEPAAYLATALVAGMKSLYDAKQADHVWVGLSHNAWQDNIKDIIPLHLIEADIQNQKSLIERGELAQFGLGLWTDHKSPVIGDCMMREIIPGGRSCLEIGNLRAAWSSGLDNRQMSIGYWYGLKGEEYEWVTVYERSVLKATKAINSRTFFHVKRREILSDAALQSATDELISSLGG